MRYSLYLPIDIYGGIFTFFLSLVETLELDENDVIYVNESISDDLVYEIKSFTKAPLKKIPGTKLKNNIIKRILAGIYLSKKTKQGKVLYIDFNPILDFISLLCKKKLVAFSHTIPKRKLLKIHRKLLSLLININSANIVAVSKYQATELKKRYYSADTLIKVVYNHSRLQGLTNKDKKSTDKIRISSVAHCVEYKGVNEWIEMANYLSSNHKNLIFTWYGDGDLLEQSREKVISNDNIRFVGYRNDISEIMEKTDIYIQLSKIENLSISILDAMNYSIPCIVSDVGAMNELIINGVNGYVTNGFDELIKSFKLLIQEKNYATMSIKSKEIYEDVFSINNWKEQINELLE